MKKLFALFLIFSLVLLTGCGTLAAIDRAEDVIDNRIDAVEDRVEDALIQNAPAPAKSVPADPSPTEAAQVIDAEQAQAIALEHAGLTAQDVSHLQSRMDYDDGRQEYDVEFYSGRVEYEYEIDAATGKVLSFDVDN